MLPVPREAAVLRGPGTSHRTGVCPGVWPAGLVGSQGRQMGDGKTSGTYGGAVGKALGPHPPWGKVRGGRPGQRGAWPARLVPELLRGRAGTMDHWSPRPNAGPAGKAWGAKDPTWEGSSPVSAPQDGEAAEGEGRDPQSCLRPARRPCTLILTCWLPAPHSPCPHCPMATHIAPVERGPLPQCPPHLPEPYNSEEAAAFCPQTWGPGKRRTGIAPHPGAQPDCPVEPPALHAPHRQVWHQQGVDGSLCQPAQP